MIRFIIRRTIDNGQTASHCLFETMVAEVPALEDVLLRGGSGPNGSRDFRELVGVEVITEPKEQQP